MDVKRIEIGKLTGDPANARKHGERNIQTIVESLNRFGQQKPIVIDSSNCVRAGNGTLEAARSLGWTHLDCVVTNLKGADAVAYGIADNRTAELAEWDTDVLAATLESLQADDLLEAAGWTDDELTKMLESLSDEEPSGEHGEGQATATLAERFMVVPFSVLNAREGWWQERKRAWLAYGIRSEAGRAASVSGTLMVSGYENGIRSTGMVNDSDTSVFDPVLCEIAYRWFSPNGGTVIDPFAGGSVRGIVASKTGRRYVGVDLREEQIEANKSQAKEICSSDAPVWYAGDSRNIREIAKGVKADLLFTCPPYADLEVYSDNPQDISTLPYDKFRDAYFYIIKEACELLDNDRFACVVVGEVRDKKGNYIDFVGDTVQAFRSDGLEYYNESILVTCVGSLPIRVGKQFSVSRKLGKTHQNFLVFVKGDGKRAAEACGDVDTADPAEMFGEVIAQ